jgi:quinol monooxygenase YgiN
MSEANANSVEIIRYTIPGDLHTNFENAYGEAAEHLKKSTHCLAYQLLHGEDEPDNYIIIIIWKSREEHLQGFRKSAEFIPFFNLVKPFYNNIVEMKHYTKKIYWER